MATTWWRSMAGPVLMLALAYGCCSCSPVQAQPKPSEKDPVADQVRPWGPGSDWEARQRLERIDRTATKMEGFLDAWILLPSRLESAFYWATFSGCLTGAALGSLFLGTLGLAMYRK